MIIFMLLVLILDVPNHQEKEVKIKTIYLYPIRGVKGCEIDECEITPYGLKKDRNWVIIGRKLMWPLTCANSHIVTYLRQEINPNKPNELRLYL